jgi:hypothetical protein
MKTKQNFIATIILLIFAITLVPTNAQAQAEPPIASGLTSAGGNVTWSLTQDGTLRISGTGAVGLTLMAYTDQLWNAHRDRVITVILEEGITAITNLAFGELPNLTTIYLPTTLMNTGNVPTNAAQNLATDNWFSGSNALTNIHVAEGNRHGFSSVDGVLFFADTVLVRYPVGRKETSYTIPSTVRTIGIGAFTQRSAEGHPPVGSLTTIVIPEGVRLIRDRAFARSGVGPVVVIPSTVTTIGGQAFAGVTGATEFIVDAENPNFSSENGVLFNHAKTTLIAYPAAASATNYTVPASVTAISTAAFDAVAALSHLVLPSSMTTIGMGTFNNFIGLKTIDMSSVTTLNAQAFMNSGLTEVVIPNAVTTLPDADVFSGTPLTSVTLSNALTRIGNNTFLNCTELKSIEFPATLTAIGSSAFRGSGLDEVEIPAGVTHLNQLVFADMALTSLEIPSTVTQIDHQAFARNPITEITVHWPTPLASGTANAANTIRTNAFEGIDIGRVILNVPEGSEAAYKAHTFWGQFIFSEPQEGEDGAITWTCFDNGRLLISGEGAMKDYTAAAPAPWNVCKSTTRIIIIDTTITSIGAFAFYGFEAATAVTIPNSVKTIGNNAFAGSGLMAVTIPSSVETIGNYAFADCEDLGAVTVQRAKPVTINANVFDGLDLEDITLNVPATGGAIADYFFAPVWGDFNITGVIAGEKIATTTINWLVREGGTLVVSGEGAMPNYATHATGSTAPWVELYRDTINSIVVGEGITSIGTFTFAQAWNTPARLRVTSISLPSTLTLIDSSAFQNNLGLTAINIPEGVTRIAFNAFDQVVASVTPGLTRITLPSTLKVIEEGAFRLANNTPHGVASLVIPEGVTTIGNFAFRNHLALRNLTLPTTLEQFGMSAFMGCAALVMVEVSWLEPPVAPRSFFGQNFNYGGTYLLVPAGSEDAYREATLWQEFMILSPGVIWEAPVITTATLPNGTENTPYDQMLEADGDEMVWTLWSGATPDGVLIFADGQLKGTPSKPGPFTFELMAVNQGGSYIKEFQITIAPDQTTSITPPTPLAVNPLKAWTQGNILHVTGLEVGQRWSVFNVSGTLVHQAIANSEQAEIGLPARGTYVIQSGNFTTKVVF